MAAVMEINILSERLIEVNELFGMLHKKYNLEIKVDSVEVMDNWEYENAMELLNLDNILKHIENKKIVSIALSICDKYNAGCQIEKIDNVYEMCLWINTLYLEYLDLDTINKKNEKVYELITDEIVKNINKYKIHIASIGIETVFEYDKDICNIINKSSGVTRWIIPNMRNQNINNYYLEDNYGSYLGIYTRVIA